MLEALVYIHDRRVIHRDLKQAKEIFKSVTSDSLLSPLMLRLLLQLVELLRWEVSLTYITCVKAVYLLR